MNVALSAEHLSCDPHALHCCNPSVDILQVAPTVFASPRKGFTHKIHRVTRLSRRKPGDWRRSQRTGQIRSLIFSGENRNGRQGKQRQRQEGTTEEGQTDSERKAEGETEQEEFRRQFINDQCRIRPVFAPRSCSAAAIRHRTESDADVVPMDNARL